MMRATLVLVFVAMAACTAKTPPLLAVPLPDLSSAEPSVRDQINAAYASLTSKKTDATAYGEMGKLLLAAEYLEAAESCFLNAEALAPREPRWPYYLGHLYKARAEAEKSAAAFERARRLQPDDVATLVWLGRAYLDQDHSELAEPVFSRALSLQARSAAAMSGLGRAALARRQYAEAARQFESALALSPQATALEYQLSLAYRGLGDAAKADAHLSRRGDRDAVPIDPWMDDVRGILHSAVAYETRGLSAMERGDYRAAIEALRQGVSYAPGNAALRHELGTALFASGDSQGAFDQFTEITRRSPEFAKAHYSLGMLLTSQRRFSEAVDRLAAAVKADPDYPAAEFQLAEALRRSGRPGESLAHYAQAIKLDPRLADAHVGYGMSLARVGRYAEARQTLAAAARALPDQPAPAQALARVLAAAPDARVREGRQAVAITQALMQKPHGVDLYEAVAMSLAELGQYDQAVQWQRGAIAAAMKEGHAELGDAMAANLKFVRKPHAVPHAMEKRPMNVGPRIIGGALMLGAVALVSGQTIVRYPLKDIGVESLAARAKAQRDTVGQFKVDYTFQFKDLVKESGITFVQRAVDDAGKYHKPVHYDHGTGIAVADVDGDGLEDVYFVNQIGGNQLWKNLGGGKFRNITADAGVALADRIGVTASFADIDNDGDQDLFVTTVRGGNVLFENDGKGRFKDISKAAGVDYVGHSSGAVFFDFDRDGLLDLYLCNIGRYTTDVKGRGGAYEGVRDAFEGHLHGDRSETSILYRNLGHNRFKDVTMETGLGKAGWSGDASVVDLNGDGFQDLYVLNMQGSDHYFENAGGRRFVDRTAQYFPRTPWGSMGVKFFDYNDDGRPDLLVTDMHSDMSIEVGPDREKQKAKIQWTEAFLRGPLSSFVFGNAFYRNLGNGKFDEISDRAGLENYWPWGPSVGDFNADGWQDVFIASSMNFPFRYGINSLLLNNRGEKFLDSEFLLGVEPRRGGRTHTPWFDVDCGTKDPDVLKRWPNSVQDLCKGRSGRLSVMATLGSRSSVIFDLDQDGDLDLITNDFNSEPQVLVSDLAQRKAIHWIKVALSGTSSNRNGIGAAVRVVADGRTLTEWQDGKSGYLSQSVLPLYFGLGDATTIDRVEVQWPSGVKQTVTSGLKVNTTLRVVETAAGKR